MTICDFNVACIFRPQDKSDTAASWDHAHAQSIKGGTGLKEWSAPETRGRYHYGPEADLFTVGCLLYLAIFGKQPFEPGQNVRATTEPLLEALPEQKEMCERKELQDLLRGLLNTAPELRMTCE